MRKQKLTSLKRRHLRLRRKINGTPERPRLCIHRSSKHLYAQLVDDRAGQTLASVTTNLKANRNEAKSFSNIAWAGKLGAQMADKAKDKGITTVVFDRGGFRYHGSIKAFADAAREGGLKF